MRPNLLIAASAAMLLAAPAAWPCGMPFGEEIEVKPSQQIVVAYQGGIETYVFSPEFCGRATDFGLILPVPATLSQNPSLASDELFAHLDTLTAPEIQQQVVCQDDEPGCMAWGRAGDDGAAPAGGYESDPGVNVVDAGHVGQFAWSLLQADTEAAFTDWLDANGYPYSASATPEFARYVQKGWYFVAFKFDTGHGPPPAGYQLCGQLGPLELSFPSTEPVIPSRIAAIAGNAELLWQIFTFAPEQLSSASSGVSQELLYSRALGDADFAGDPELSSYAQAGDRITKLNLTFTATALSDDIVLEADPNQRDFRATEVRYVTEECGGCNVPHSSRRMRIPVVDIVLGIGALWLAGRTVRRVRDGRCGRGSGGRKP
jgi:hypothetical protein